MRFLNIEKIIYDYLRKEFDNVYLFIPAERPKRFITIERAGGSQYNQVQDQALVAIQCWAETRYKASELAYQVDEALRNSVVSVREICKAERTGFTNLPDPESKQARYQILFTFLVTV